jgi:hypothetical protein
VGKREIAVFTSVSARSTAAVPIAPADAALPQRFPWLLTSSSGQSRQPSVAHEFAIFAEEAREWAALAFPAGIEAWPDDWPDE